LVAPELRFRKRIGCADDCPIAAICKSNDNADRRRQRLKPPPGIEPLAFWGDISRLGDLQFPVLGSAAWHH